MAENQDRDVLPSHRASRHPQTSVLGGPLRVAILPSLQVSVGCVLGSNSVRTEPSTCWSTRVWSHLACSLVWSEMAPSVREAGVVCIVTSPHWPGPWDPAGAQSLSLQPYVLLHTCKARANRTGGAAQSRSATGCAFVSRSKTANPALLIELTSPGAATPEDIRGEKRNSGPGKAALGGAEQQSCLRGMECT